MQIKVAKKNRDIPQIKSIIREKQRQVAIAVKSTGGANKKLHVYKLIVNLLIFVKKTIGTVSYDEGAASVTSSTLFDMASLSKILSPVVPALPSINILTIL